MGGCSEEIRLDRLNKILLSDPDETVARLRLLWIVKSWKKDSGLVTLLARFPHDESGNLDGARSAYTAIFDVLGGPLPEQPKNIQSPEDFD